MAGEVKIAATKDQLAHSIMSDSYELYGIVKSGERDIKIEFIVEARKFLELVEKEIRDGRKRK